MRVAIDVTSLLGVRTGIGQFVIHLLDALDALDDRPDVVPYALSHRARRRRDELPTGTRFLPLPARALLGAWARADRPRADRWLGRPDVVHATNFVAPPMRQAATVVTVHDCWCARHPETCPPGSSQVTASLRRAFRRGAWAHVSTEFVAGEVADVFGTDRIAIVPFGVPDVGPSGPGGALPAEVGTDRYVLALGTAEPRKNLGALVRAFGAPGGPGRAHPRLRLVLAGPEGPATPAVESAIGALPPPLAERVVRLGAVGDATRRSLLSCAAVLAYPSLEEGFGFPVLEAMTAGVPVVASTAGALPEVAGDAAVLVEPADVDGLAAALTRVVDDGALRATLVRRGRARVAGRSWTRTARGLAELWAKLAS